MKTDADVMREKLLQITETRNQLRGKAIALAQEVMSLSVWFLVCSEVTICRWICINLSLHRAQVVDLLKPDISIDCILDLDVSADVEVTLTGSTPKLKSLAQRAIKTVELLVEHKKQVRK